MKSATRRAWIAVGCGVLLLIVTCGGLVTGGLYLLARIPEAAPVREALAHAESDPRVVELIGAPLEARSLPSNVELAYGRRGTRIEFDVQVRGPRRDGFLSVSGTRAHADAPWGWQRFLVIAGGEELDLATVPPHEHDGR